MGRTIIWLSIIFVVLVASFSAGYMTYTYIVDNYGAEDSFMVVPFENQLIIEIPRGSGTEAISNILFNRGIIKYPYVFRIYSRINGYDGVYRAGGHVIDKTRDYNSLKGFDMLMEIFSSNPLNAGTKIRIPDGYTIEQIGEVLVSRNVLSSKQDFLNYIKEATFEFSFLDLVTRKLYQAEGYLMPDTYEYEANSTNREVILMMLRNFENKMTKELTERASHLDMTIDEVVILASIIERESKSPVEMATISGVFHNRLNNSNGSMRKLQSPETLKYILEKDDVILEGELTSEDEAIESPYNTYIREGLPPGPICNPGTQAIEAALYPEKHDYLYFTLKRDNTGLHYFAKTYTEHLGNQLKAQVNASRGGDD